MNIEENFYYTEEAFEEIQANYNGKAEYDNGAIFLSSNTSQNHNRIKRRVLSKLDSYFRNSKCEPFDEQIEVIFKNENELRKYKPDIFIACDNMEKQGESFIGSPKLIFEIISKSTAAHDYITKLAIYQRFGVLEYNIIEQDGFIVQYTLIDNQYKITNTFKNDDCYISTVFPELKIDLEDIF